jgi:carboxymethylenebutenolidase
MFSSRKDLTMTMIMMIRLLTVVSFVLFSAHILIPVGGMFALQAGLAIPELSATVVYYGMLETDHNKLTKLSSPLLGIFGGKDQGVTVERVQQFESDLDQLKKEHTIHIYENADHAFANPTGQRYEPVAAADAWKKTMAFFEKHLKA